MATKETTAFVHLLLQVTFMLTTIDKLKGTDRYRHKLKAVLKTLETELRSYDDVIEGLCKVSNYEELYAAMEGIERCIKFISELSVEQLISIGKEGINLIEKEPVHGNCNTIQA